MSKNELPFDILEQILQEFVNRLLETQDREIHAPRAHLNALPYLNLGSYAELIQLRLISKTWSRAVIMFYFETISIDNSGRANLILDNWKDDLFLPNHCPVKRLSIKKLCYLQEDEVEAQERDKDDVVSMYQAAKLIKLLGVNLNTLDLQLTIGCMEFSPDFITAIHTVQNLKSLYIRRVPLYPLYAKSVSELFSAIPRLEYLLLDDAKLTGRFDLRPPALSNLLGFSINIQLFEVNHIITQAARNLKVLEVCRAENGAFSLELTLKPVQESLEGLFVLSIVERLASDINVPLPNLRVLGRTDTGFSWDCLQRPELRSVRTLVTDIAFAAPWKLENRLSAGKNSMTGPNLKHIIFIKHQHYGARTLAPEVAEAFEAIGIQCHVMYESTAMEFMELDIKLNGPPN